MKRLILFLGLITTSTALWAGGNSYDLPVSSGSGYRTVDMYQNTGTTRDRQAIVIGDRSSSATVTVDAVTGMVVQLATSSANGVGNVGIIAGQSVINSSFSIFNALPAGSNSLGNVNINSTSTLNVSQQGNLTLNALPAGSNSIGNVNVISTNTLNVAQQGNVTLNALPAGSSSLGNVNINSSSTLNVAQQGNITINSPAITNTAFGITAGQSLINSTFTLVSTTITVQNIQQALPAGSNSLGNVNITSTNTLAVSGSLTANSVNITTTSFNGALPLALSIVGGINSNGNGQSFASSRSSGVVVNIEPGSFFPAYVASTQTFATAANATIVSAICGNSTAGEVIAVTKFQASCTQTTAGVINGSLIKYSTKFTGAWSTMTVTPLDSNYAVTNSSAVWFTANPLTTGTELGHVYDNKFGCVAPGTASPNDVFSYNGAPIYLRSASECLGFNLEGQTVTGGAIAPYWEFKESTKL